MVQGEPWGLHGLLDIIVLSPKLTFWSIYSVWLAGWVDLLWSTWLLSSFALTVYLNVAGVSLCYGTYSLFLPLTSMTNILVALPILLVARHINCPTWMTLARLMLSTIPLFLTLTPGVLWVTSWPSLNHLMVGKGLPLAWQGRSMVSSWVKMIWMGSIGPEPGVMPSITGRTAEIECHYMYFWFT